MEVEHVPVNRFKKGKNIWLLAGYVVVSSIMFLAFEETRRSKNDIDQMLADLMLGKNINSIKAISEKHSLLLAEGSGLNTLLSCTDGLKKRPSVEQVVPVRVRYTSCRIEKEDPEEAVYDIVDNMPDFPGGQAALMKYLAKNIKYPPLAQERDIQGRVIVQFIVNKNGKVSDARVVRGVDRHLNIEAVRVINSMPDWKPGIQHGKPVRVRLTIPVIFRLR